MSQNIAELLRNVPAAHLARPRKWLATGHVSDSVSSVFDSLLASDVHAIPLFDRDNQAPMGIVDVFDVLAYTVDKCKLTDMEKLHSTLEDTAYLKSQFQGPARDLIRKAGKPEYVTLSTASNIQTAIEVLVAEDVDRVALLDDKSLQFVSILSAIDIVRFIAMRLSEKWSSTQLEGLQVREAFLHNRTMYTREKDALALDVFLTMHRHHAGGCALVDARGYLAGNISVSDFKHIGSHGESLPLLLKPAVDFIKSAREPIFVTLDTAVSDAVSKFDLTNVHRIFIVAAENDTKPIAEVALKDILQLLTRVHPRA